MTLTAVACSAVPGDDLADQEAQDLAWGFQRSTHAGPAHFLVQNGEGSFSESKAYYARIMDGQTPDRVNLSTWQSQYVTGNRVNSYYRNKNELDFWRDMTCSAVIRRGSGGCMVTNWRNETDRNDGKANLGTVAMNVSPEGFARFYVFLPDGTLSPSALLDSEGPKFAPRLCTVCHGGGVNAEPDKRPDLGSIFREFEPSVLQAQSGLSRADAEAQWFALNQAIRTANQSIRGEAEGAPEGVDHAKAAMSAHLDELYPDLAPPARRLFDPELVPVSWQAKTSTETNLWKTTAAPYCMGCHRHNGTDLSHYASFAFLQKSSEGKPLFLQYTAASNHPHSLPYMPQSEVTFNRLATDDAAQAAIRAWLPCVAGQTCVPSNPCHQGVTTCDGGNLSCEDTGVLVKDGTACANNGTCSNGACTTTSGCNTNVLVLGDTTDTSDSDTLNLAQALRSAGLEPTLVPNGTIDFDGTTSTSFGAILVTPGRTYASDMTAPGQDAIVRASAAGAGVVFTEWAAYEVTEGHYQTLKPLLLLERTDGTTQSVFTLTANSHPIWTGLEASFSVSPPLPLSTGTIINGGTAIANAGSFPAVIVREATQQSGRIVHVAHSASYTAGWTANASGMLMFTNAMRWAAHCL